MPEQFNHAAYASRLRHLRVHILHMTTKEFAARADVSPGTISHHETAKVMPTAYILFNFCKTFGVSADWLLGLTEE